MEAGRTPRVALKKKGRVIPSLFASNHISKHTEKEKRRAHLRARCPWLRVAVVIVVRRVRVVSDGVRNWCMGGEVPCVA